MNLPPHELKLILHLLYLRVKETLILYIFFPLSLVLFSFGVAKTAGSSSTRSWYFLKAHSSKVHSFRRFLCMASSPLTFLPYFSAF